VSRQSWRGSIHATIGHHPARKYLLRVRGRERGGGRENIVPLCAYFLTLCLSCSSLTRPSLLSLLSRSSDCRFDTLRNTSVFSSWRVSLKNLAAVIYNRVIIFV